MQNFIKERDILIDDIIKFLIREAGFNIPKAQNDFEYIMLVDDMAREGYKIKQEKMQSGIRICLYKLEKLVYAYDLEVRRLNNEVKIIAIPVK